MIFLKMVWRNLWRNTRRTVITMAAIVFATMLPVFMFSLQTGGYDQLIENTVRIHSGHLQIQRQGYYEEKDINQTVDEPERIYSILEGVEGVESYAPRINAPVLVSTDKGTSGVLVIGMDPEREARVSSLKRNVKAGKYLRKDEPFGALIGEILAKNLSAGVGSELVFLGQAADGSLAADRFTVRGIFRSGVPEFDRMVAGIPFDTAQELFSLWGRSSEIAVVLDRPEDLPRVKNDLEAEFSRSGLDRYRILDWDALIPGLTQAITLDRIGGYLFYSILLFVVGFGILNTFLTSVFERMREIGVMSSLGLRPQGLFAMVVLEALILTFIGVVIGAVAGAIFVVIFTHVGIPVPGREVMAEWGLPDRMYPILTFKSIWMAALLVSLIAFLVSLYPARKIARIRPVEALRYV